MTIDISTESITIPYVKADVEKLRQILTNLLNNAVKFTDEGGIAIRVSSVPISGESNRCQVVIEVEDSGQGIEPAMQREIFEPFKQVEDVPERKGTGLGLAICKRYVELMSGTIDVESEIGKGSLFRVSIPVDMANAADCKPSDSDEPLPTGLAPSQRACRVLVVDDNRDNLLLLRSLLEDVGFLVLDAENGQEAVELFQRESPDFIWMDMRMPVMDGYAATRTIRTLTGGDRVKIVAITASAFKEQHPDILEAGCDDVVLKPFKEHEIFEMMGTLLNIEYIYEQESKSASSREGQAELTAASLTEVPKELLHELKEATLALDREAAFEATSRIAGHAPEIASGLKEMVDNFQMAELSTLLGEIDDAADRT